MTGHTPECVCGQGWRFEATDLHTGQVKAVLHPVAAEWEERYSASGTGTLTLATRDPAADDIWPHTTGVYISRIIDGGTDRDGRFGGYVEKFSASSGGATEVGLKTMDDFLAHRLLVNADEGIEYSTPGYVDAEHPGPGRQQTLLATDLVTLALGTISEDNGVPLFGVPDVSTHLRVAHWDAWDFKNLGDALTELTGTAGGVQYRLRHEWFETLGKWITHIEFMDESDHTSNVVIRSDQQAWQYGLEIDGKDQASRVYGIGAGEGAGQSFSVAYDAAALLPEFQATLAWKDVSIPRTLDEHTRGEVINRRDPVAVPTAVIAGLDIAADALKPGDIVSPDIGYGVATYRGQQARIGTITWRVADGPLTRALELVPIIRPSESVKTQTPAIEPVIAETPEETETPPPVTPIKPPAPPEGIVVKVQVAALNEISALQTSAIFPGNVWAGNDENNTPQLRLISLSDGKQVASLTPSGPARVDPESLAKHPDGRLVLGDTGDNANNRTSRHLYAFAEPTSPGDHGVVNAQVYPVSYPFGAKNAETLMIHPKTGHWVIVTKEAAGGRAVSFGNGPDPLPMGTVIASGLPANISDGTFSINGEFMFFTVAGTQHCYVYRWADWAGMGTIDYPVPLTKCESITAESECSLLISSEGSKPPIVRVNIPPQFGSTCA